MRRFRLQVLGHQHEQAAALARLHQNPLDLDTQRRIEQLIQERRIDENMTHALEYHPEAFASVTMLYVPCQVNGIPLKVFVDCGAQATISTWESGMPSPPKLCGCSHGKVCGKMWIRWTGG